jgi:DNA repair photolyase
MRYVKSFLELKMNQINNDKSIKGILEKKSKLRLIPHPITSETPIVDELEAEADRLNKRSLYKSEFSWKPFRDLELRSHKMDLRGGILFKSPLKLVNSHSTCQQCLYSFEIDTYGRGCSHNCVYCYAKAELTVYGYWNNPFPAPVNINDIRKIFNQVFESDSPSKWREILQRRIPLRIGSMSDSFMWMDDKYKVTKELLKILKFYKYPYVVFTRSDLIARDDYLELIDPTLASIQFSISSTNDELNKKIEPGAPSAARRLKALKHISTSGYWTTVRINPVFPIHPDGFFTNPDFSWSGEIPKFEYFSFDIIDEIKEAKVKSVIAGFGRFSSYSLSQIEQVTGFILRNFYKNDEKKSKRDFHFSDLEVRYYYEQIQKRCIEAGIQFTTCYIGNGENQFWSDQDLWSNKADCCNIKGRVAGFKNDARELPFESRLRFSANKDAIPVDSNTLHKPLDSDTTLIKPRITQIPPEVTI